MPQFALMLFLAANGTPAKSDSTEGAIAIAPRSGKGKVEDGGLLDGTVLEVTKDSITLRPWDGGKPRQFVASARLAAGGPRRSTVPYHHLSDVKVGDYVEISLKRSDGVDICDAIEIERRPGGKIPPAQYPPNMTRPPAGWPHETRQAHWDWEEKGIPIPAQFLSDGRAPWTNPPYPPVAPMPREVKK